MLFMFFIASVFVIFANNFSSASDRTKGLMIHDKLLTNAILVDQTRDMFLYYGLAAVAYFLLVWIYMLVYSHRLTGPVYKLTRHLEKASQSDELPKHIKFRKGDAFHELADSFNKFVTHLENKKQSSK